jgi:hypothetical protein
MFKFTDTYKQLLLEKIKDRWVTYSLTNGVINSVLPPKNTIKSVPSSILLNLRCNIPRYNYKVPRKWITIIRFVINFHLIMCYNYYIFMQNDKLRKRTVGINFSQKDN